MFSNEKMENYYKNFVKWVEKENNNQDSTNELMYLKTNANELPISAIMGTTYVFNKYEKKAQFSNDEKQKNEFDDITNLLEQMMLSISAYSVKHRSAHKYAIAGIIKNKLINNIQLTENEKIEIVKWIEQRKDLIKNFVDVLDTEYIKYIVDADKEFLNLVTIDRYNELLKCYGDRVL